MKPDKETNYLKRERGNLERGNKNQIGNEALFSKDGRPQRVDLKKDHFLGNSYYRKT